MSIILLIVLVMLFPKLLFPVAGTLIAGPVGFVVGCILAAAGNNNS